MKNKEKTISKTVHSYKKSGLLKTIALGLCFSLFGTGTIYSQTIEENAKLELAPPKFSIASPIFLGLGTVSLGIGTALWFTSSQDDPKLPAAGILAGAGALSVLIGFLAGTMDLDLERIDPSTYLKEGSGSNGSDEKASSLSTASGQNVAIYPRINLYLRANEVGIRIK